MNRENKPAFLVEWERGRPKCCHNCDHYTMKGICRIASAAPPPEFVNSRDQCDEWKEYRYYVTAEDVPF